MTSRIRVLEEDTINKIAAGEVIENPASVVKELVENSIDAGATEIIIDIVDGGRQMVRITDNGSGMSPDDALLSLERHATSKLKGIDDIHALHTMGFRGEAIPSIASISKFTLLTRLSTDTGVDELGTMVCVDGGKIMQCSPVACARGTTIEVKSLFFNVPVRKKFQKSSASDVVEIQRMVTLLALGNPAIKFQLISNRQTVLHALFSTGTSFHDILGERIKYVLGSSYFDSLLPLEESQESYTLKGFIGVPDSSKHNRTGQHLFINRRGVQSPLVSFAVRDGYGTMLGTGRHPIYVLHLDMDGDFVDVNVHPQKREVRLRQEHILKSVTTSAVENALQRRPPLACAAIGYREPEGLPSDPAPRSESFTLQASPFILPPEKEYGSPFDLLKHTIDEDLLTFESPHYAHATPPPEAPGPAREGVLSEPSLPETLSAGLPPVAAAPPHPTTFGFEGAVEPRFKAVLTIKSYVLAQKGEGGAVELYFVDQRAARARIAYEKLLKGSQEIALQGLLVPYTVSLPPTEAASLREVLTLLQSVGVHIKEFGNNSFVVDALPAAFGNVDLKQLIDELLEGLHSSTHTDLLDRERKKSIALAASRAAALQEGRLTLPEAAVLLEELLACDTPMLCPSGRKTMALCAASQIATLFQSKAL